MKSSTFLSKVISRNLLDSGVSNYRQLDMSVSAAPRQKFPIWIEVDEKQVTAKSYYTIESYKRPSSTCESGIWDSWNKLMLDMLQKHAGLFESRVYRASDLRDLFDDIPSNYVLRSRLHLIECELESDDDAAPINVKSLFCMLRFLPLLEEKHHELAFYLDDDSGQLGVSLVGHLKGGAKKTLDLVFKDDGEIFFTFMEGGEGFSRISGNSYLTDYLVNSYKFRKLINIFDY
ncbi:hypothetical protein [Pseudomonas baltica]|uniref:Uncharacterized protein n=1 Tax=Pseudomonas baltica TaxID=2762576 RepID=A0A7X1G9S4_9PSED|nr:hypothetical protein [Pseudomonas baltica]MBC2680726.1 hypothetical protein [Pseudomonas baltica]